ncbi:MAG: hypothetical protein ACREIT_08880, partial [Tepidisphaeraceae bacterium]
MSVTTAAATHSATLSQPVESLAGVGSSRARELRKLGVETLGDLLEYFPRDYQYESSEKSIHELVPDQIQNVRGEVVAVNYIPTRPRPRFEATLDDQSGAKLSLVWFHGAFLRTRIHPGMHVRVKGAVRFFRGIAQMTQAKWEVVDADTARIEDATFRAIYPASMRLPSEVIARIMV